MLEFNAHDIAKAAKTAFQDSQIIPSSERVNALYEIRKSLEANKAEIIKANEEDLKVGADLWNWVVTDSVQSRQQRSN